MIAKAGLMVCLKLKPECDLCGSRFKDANESFYKNEGIWEEKKQKNNIAYFDSFSFKTEL